MLCRAEFLVCQLDSRIFLGGVLVWFKRQLCSTDSLPTDVIPSICWRCFLDKTFLLESFQSYCLTSKQFQTPNSCSSSWTFLLFEVSTLFWGCFPLHQSSRRTSLSCVLYFLKVAVRRSSWWLLQSQGFREILCFLGLYSKKTKLRCYPIERKRTSTRSFSYCCD